MKVTKTLNPLHFEDLEPKRFEDLVRELIYDFRDWYKIEPTGRTGSDEGYDARAWEKGEVFTNSEDSEKNEDDPEEEGKRTSEGNLWMIQCKREKELGPKRIKEIIEESLKEGAVPYGFLLAAPVNFSKKSYDAFAEALRAKGVMEFFLWGKGDLEHALLMPKNDRILFAFFGISLLIKRRSKVSDIRFSVNNKNKLLRLFGINDTRESLLLRDINESDYPYDEKVKKENKKPKWGEQIMVQLHPKGLVFHVREYYAYYDADKKLFQFTKTVDLVNRPKETLLKHQQSTGRDKDWDEREKVEYFYQNLPRKNQAKLHTYGFLSFQDMLLIDTKGDNYFEIPHIFVEYNEKTGPFTSIWNVLKCNGEEIELNNKLKTAKVFPDKFPEIKRGTVYKDKYLEWDDFTARQFRNENVHRFYDIDNKYSFLNLKDVIAVKADMEGGEDDYAQVTHKYTITVKEHLELNKHYLSKESLEKELGRTINETEKLTVYEIIKVYSWKLKEKQI